MFLTLHERKSSGAPCCPDAFTAWAARAPGREPALRGGLQQSGSSATISLYFSVPDVDAAILRVWELGGRAEEPMDEEPGFGRFASCHDDQGVSFGPSALVAADQLASPRCVAGGPGSGVGIPAVSLYRTLERVPGPNWDDLEQVGMAVYGRCLPSVSPVQRVKVASCCVDAATSTRSDPWRPGRESRAVSA